MEPVSYVSRKHKFYKLGIKNESENSDVGKNCEMFECFELNANISKRKPETLKFWDQLPFLFLLAFGKYRLG
jgi:hypothetical protein